MTGTPHVLEEVDRFIVLVWDEVENFMSRHSIGPTAFSRAAASDPNLVRQIREGRRRLTLTMATRLKRFIDEWQPATEPETDVARPIRPAKTPVSGTEIRR